MKRRHVTYGVQMDTRGHALIHGDVNTLPCNGEIPFPGILLADAEPVIKGMSVELTLHRETTDMASGEVCGAGKFQGIPLLCTNAIGPGAQRTIAQ